MGASHVVSFERFRGFRQASHLVAAAVTLLAVAAQASRAADAAPVVPTAEKPATTVGATSQPAGEAGKLQVDKPEFLFPETWSGEKVEHTYILKNIGKGTLTVTAVRPACGCTLAGEWDKKIEPGKEGKVPLAINTQHLRGEVTKQITVETSDTTNPRMILTMKGKIKSAIDMEPVTGFSFGQLSPQSAKSITLKLTNNMDQPWTLSYTPDAGQPQQAAFEITIKETEKGKKAEVTAKLKEPLKEGSTIAQIKLATGLTKQAELTIPANYYLAPALQVLPNPLYGQSIPGRDFTSTINVTYNREGDLNILSVTPSDPAIKAVLNPAQTTEKRHYTISVTLPKDFVIDQAKRPTIEIKTDKTNLPNNGVVSVPIMVRPQQTPMAPPPDPALQLVGKPAPVVTLKDTEGKEVKIGGKTGSVTMIDFWATWCPHCRRQIPVLAKIMKEYGSKGVKLISVSTDSDRPNPTTGKTITPQEIADMAKQFGGELPIVLDPKAEAFPPQGPPSSAPKMYAGGGIPMLFLVSKEGIIEAIHRGEGMPGQDFEGQIKKELDLLLAGKSIPRQPVTPPATPPVAAKPATPAVPQVKGPGLFIDSPRQDVGARKPGDTSAYSLAVRNNGTEPVEIKAVKPGSDAVTVDASSPKSIAPGAASAIKLNIKTPKTPGPFQQTVSVESNDPNHAQQTITLAGTVRNYLEVQPPEGVTFPRNPHTQSIPSLATLVWNGEGTIEYGKPESSSPKFEATIEPILNGPYAKLIVRTKPPLDPGENNGIIHIKTSSKEQPLLDVPVKLFVPQRVEVSPTEVLLAPMGRLQKSMVSIRNNGDKSLSILGVKASNEKIHWQFYPEADGLSYKLMILVPATDPGQGAPANEKIVVRTDDAEFGEIVIPIRFNAAGAQGSAAGAR